MARKERFPLVLKDDVPVRTLEELQDYFDIDRIVEYYKNGQLEQWLKDRYYEEESEKIFNINSTGDDLKADLYKVFDIHAEGALNIIREREDRRNREEAERKAKEEAERKAKEEAERKAREEAERKTIEERKKKRLRMLKILGGLAVIGVIILKFAPRINTDSESDIYVNEQVPETSSAAESWMVESKDTSAETKKQILVTEAKRDSEDIIEASAEPSSSRDDYPETKEYVSTIESERDSEDVTETAVESSEAWIEEFDKKSVESSLESTEVSLPSNEDENDNCLDIGENFVVEMNDRVIEFVLNDAYFKDDYVIKRTVNSDINLPEGYTALVIKYTVNILDSSMSVLRKDWAFKLKTQDEAWDHYDNDLTAALRNELGYEAIGKLGNGESSEVLRGYIVPQNCIQNNEDMVIWLENSIHLFLPTEGLENLTSKDIR